MVKYSTWLISLEGLMKHLNLIKKDCKLDENSWRMYYDEEMTRQQAMDEEFGLEWRKINNY